MWRSLVLTASACEATRALSAKPSGCNTARSHEICLTSDAFFRMPIGRVVLCSEAVCSFCLVHGNRPSLRMWRDGPGPALSTLATLANVMVEQVQLRLRSLSDVLHGGVKGPGRARRHIQSKSSATQNSAMVDQSLEHKLHRTTGPKSACA